jgi:hypothetical protein
MKAGGRRKVEGGSLNGVLHLLYTIDGQPNKAFFTREMKAVIQVPVPGKYRVKLWINELFHQTGEVFSGEKEMQIN